MSIAGNDRRWLRPAAGVILAVVLAAGAVFVLATRGGGAGDEFEQAAETFHDKYDSLSQQLDQHLAQASGGFGDSSFSAAQQDARRLADAFVAYGDAIKAISFPEPAKPAAADLVKATDGGKLIMVNVAGFFTKSQMQRAVDEFGPQVESLIDRREGALRTALDG